MRHLQAAAIVAADTHRQLAEYFSPICEAFYAWASARPTAEVRDLVALEARLRHRALGFTKDPRPLYPRGTFVRTPAVWRVPSRGESVCLVEGDYGPTLARLLALATLLTLDDLELWLTIHPEGSLLPPPGSAADLALVRGTFFGRRVGRTLADGVATPAQAIAQLTAWLVPGYEATPLNLVGRLGRSPLIGALAVWLPFAVLNPLSHRHLRFRGPLIQETALGLQLTPTFRVVLEAGHSRYLAEMAAMPETERLAWCQVQGGMGCPVAARRGAQRSGVELFTNLLLHHAMRVVPVCIDGPTPHTGQGLG